MDKKKSWIFPFILCLLVAIFTFNWNKISAETPEVSVSGQSKILKYQITKEVFSTGTYNSGQLSESTLIMICLEKMLKQEIQL